MYGIEKNNKLISWSHNKYAEASLINLDEFTLVDENYYRKGFEPEVIPLEYSELREQEYPNIGDQQDEYQKWLARVNMNKNKEIILGDGSKVTLQDFLCITDGQLSMAMKCMAVKSKYPKY